MNEKLEKNLEVVKEELKDFQMYLEVVKYKVSHAKTFRQKVHHAVGILPDIYRALPRTITYINLTLFSVVSAYFLARWLV
jgi:hypothetical protein